MESEKCVISTPEKPDKPYRERQKIVSVKRIIVTLTIFLFLYVIYMLYNIFLTPDKNLRQIYLIPKDAALIIQADEPIADWNRFSSSQPWQSLTQAPSFGEIAASTNLLDSILRENQTLLSLVGKREMMISLHKTKPKNWDFLIVIDLKKVSKVKALKEQIEQVLKATGFTVTQRKYKDFNVIEARDNETREILNMAFVDNHFIVSYTPQLIQASIDEREKPQIGLEHSFMEAERLSAGKGLCRIYVNYAYLPQFLSIYLGGNNTYLDAFSGSMDFAGLWLDTSKDKIEASGTTLMNNNPDPYVAALVNSGNHKIKAQDILSGRTAFYANIGFENPTTFVAELEKAMQEKDKSTYDSYVKTRKQIEKYFNISLEENFLSWMDGEFAVTQSEAGLLGSEPEMILAIRANNIKDARKNLDIIEKSIKKRTPIKIKNVEYKGYEVNYVELKGFFRLFFGSLFDSFEKPYYTFVDDYVVFSNRSASLLSFIEDYEQKNLLKNDKGFKSAFGNVKNASTVFAYVDMQKIFPQLRGYLGSETWNDMKANQDVLYSFPQWTFQLASQKQGASLQLVMDYKKYEIEELGTVSVEELDDTDKAMNEDADSEKELMSELKRFYVEKFQGNVLREFYNDGTLKSESEVKHGKRDGRYREFYENGTMRVRGKYVAGKPRGTWKYYTEEGKFDRKEKF